MLRKPFYWLILHTRWRDYRVLWFSSDPRYDPTRVKRIGASNSLKIVNGVVGAEEEEIRDRNHK